MIAADPATADQRHDAAISTRRVECYRDADGMATVAATVTADEAMTTMRALTALAHRSRADGDTRPIDLLRADAFADLFAHALADPTLPTEQRARPAVGLTIDTATLLKLADNPAQLDGYGPIPPAMARRIAAGADWHRLVTDPVTGALLDYGRSTYRPPHRTRRVPGRAGPHLPLPHLQPPRPPLRHRPRTRLGRRRRDQCGHHRRALPPQPPAKNPPRLEAHRPPRRRRHLHQPHRPHLPATRRRPLPRTHRPPQKAPRAGRRTTRPRRPRQRPLPQPPRRTGH